MEYDEEDIKYGRNIDVTKQKYKPTIDEYFRQVKREEARAKLESEGMPERERNVDVEKVEKVSFDNAGFYFADDYIYEF